VAAGLTKARIVDAALTLLDEVGIDGLTVRAVASRLGVQAPALYWHVRDKQDLLDEMGTEIWRRVGAGLAACSPASPWRTLLTTYATITRQALLSHRDGAKVFSGTYLTDATLLERQETFLAALVAQGFTPAGAARAFALLYTFTVGFCIEEQAVAQAAAAGDARYSLDHRAQRFDAASHPLVLQAGETMFGNPDQHFADLLTLLIDAVDPQHTVRSARQDV
jgi:AcrR family transcriptional regulator